MIKELSHLYGSNDNGQLNFNMLGLGSTLSLAASVPEVEKLPPDQESRIGSGRVSGLYVE